VLHEGQVIEGKYRIVRLIGVGGMGAVYEGENTRIKRRVAIKVLHAAAAANSDAVERFEREAQAAGRIGSDHILEVLDLGTLEDGDHYMVMEFLDGETLGSRIKSKGRLSPQETVPLMRQALLGLSAAHAAGIVHRDLKPENIFICKEKAGVHDFVKIIDFGVSKFHSMGSEGFSMTRTGAVMGTPYYMSPEQAKGSRDIDARSDLYTMGVILYEAVTGQVPFNAETFNELLFKIVLSEPVPLRQILPEIDPAFESITLKAMSRDTAHRFQSADEFSQSLERWAREGTPVTIPPAVGHEAPGGTELMPQVPEPARVPTVAANPQAPPPGGGSVSAWASSQTEAVPKRSGLNPALIAGAAGLVLVLVAGGAFGVWRVIVNGKAEREAAAAAAQASAEAAVVEAPETPPAPPPPTAAETAKTEPEKTEPEKAEPEKDEPEKTGDTKVAAKGVAPKGTPAPKSTPSATGSKTATPKPSATRDYGY
jgi:serine/threonine-protein kinase